MVTTFELTGTGKAFAEYLCEFCGAKYVNSYKIASIYMHVIIPMYNISPI